MPGKFRRAHHIWYGGNFDSLICDATMAMARIMLFPLPLTPQKRVP
jgi:hypothetical protein